MEVLFLVSAGVISYTYAAYPALVALMGWWRPRRWRKDEDYLPCVTLVVSAYNEERVIDEKLRNCLALDYPRDRFEVIVASESTDGTHDIVRRYAAQGVVLRAYRGRAGKSATLFRVVPNVRGTIVVFSDANAFYRRDAIRKLVRNFADPSVGCVIGRLQYSDPADSLGVRGELVYWLYDRWVRDRATRARGLVPGLTGGIFGIRKHLYYPISTERGDDFELCTRIAIRRHEVVFEPEAVADEQASETTAQQFNRKVRLVRWNTVSSLLLIREAISLGNWLVAVQVLSHRFLRYTVPWWLIGALVSAIMLASNSLAFRLILAVQLLFYAVGLAGCAADAARVHLPKLWLVPAYFLVVNSAAMLAVIASVSRGQQTTWEKQR